MRTLLIILLFGSVFSLQAKPFPVSFFNDEVEIKADTTTHVVHHLQILEPELVIIFSGFPGFLVHPDALLTNAQPIHLENAEQNNYLWQTLINNKYAWGRIESIDNTLISLEEIEKIETLLQSDDEWTRIAICSSIPDSKIETYQNVETNSAFEITGVEESIYYRGLGLKKENDFNDLSLNSLKIQLKN
jgi:hypothetical protein